jgi:hypothetical protein
MRVIGVEGLLMAEKPRQNLSRDSLRHAEGSSLLCPREITPEVPESGSLSDLS